MKHSLPIVVALTLAAACTSVKEPKEVTLPEEPTGYVALPNEEMAKRSGATLKELHIGFGVYLRKCGECHQQILPDEISGKDWHVVTPRMAWNANITDQEQEALLKYLIAARNTPRHLHIQMTPEQAEAE